MLIFVTGAAGFIGRAVTEELVSAGHQVLGLVRSDAAEQTVVSLGATALRGDIEDLDSLKKGANQADGVIHLAFVHDFANMPRACEIDRNAIRAMAEAMKGTKKPLVMTTGTLFLPPGDVNTEDTEPNRESAFAIRVQSEDLIRKLSAELDIRGSVVRLSPTVHDVGDKGFIPMLGGMAQKNGFVTFIPGDAHWPAVHRRDAAVLFRLAVEKGRPAAIYHGVGEEGVRLEDTMTAVAKKLKLPTKGLSQAEASETIGFFAHVLHVNNRTSSAKTQAELGWQPKRETLLKDIEQNYFNS